VRNLLLRVRPDSPGQTVGSVVIPSPGDIPKHLLVMAIVLFWTFYGAIRSAIALENLDWDPDTAVELVAFSFGGAYLWALLSLPMFRVVHAIQTSERSLGIRTALLGGIGLFAGVFVAVVVVTSALALDGVLASNGFFAYFRNRISVDVLSAFLVLMAGMAWSYLHTLSMRQRETVALRAQLVESRLESLRVQLNPHLLFNTLNAIAALATVDPAKVQRSIAQLSDLLRYMLEGSADQEVTVAKEFAILRRYFEILELRYGKYLRTSITGDAEAMAAFVPNLVLQPLAENALKHGVSKAGEGSIDVHAARAGDDLVLTVRDSGSGGLASPARTESAAGAGFGLRHTCERLKHLYDGKYSFEFRPTPGGTVVEIRIPYHTRPLARAS
jgi:hypothetical protein